ncbi:liprin-beta-1-like isoform X2 [Stegodyphus dumicola]|uniref:liprin-beta-1-like isoform X2 n=1 Tax=Stegodyphus dumicola TaxID=202533 RepID=UPI0015AD04F2|nr:liprin-beta-1-like isoform X2 [Stegodyphus dumicola]
MKSRPGMENKVTPENGVKSSAGVRIVREKQDGEDTDDDDDEDRDEPATVTTSVADSCSASHEFQWLSPGSQGMTYAHLEKVNEATAFAEMQSERQPSITVEESGTASCQVSPARSSHHRTHKSPAHVWPRRSTDIGEHIQLSPSPCHELHGCRRHLSPMRSSWCCPSPPPHALCLHHHGGSILSSLELLPYSRDCYGTEMSLWPYHNCSCLPPTGLPSSRYQETHTSCRNASPHHEILRRESSSPCAMHRPCQGLGGSRRSRSSNSKKRDCSPSAMSPRYSPVQGEQITSVRHLSHDQWQVPVHSEDIGSLQKVQELESDKKSLLLQASVLADQVEAQADKISELERLLDQKKEELIHLEQSLHQEMLARSAVESSKLELMAELSNLRLRLTASERDKKENEVKCRKLESELHLLQARLFEQEAEHAALRGKLSQSGMPMLSGNQSIEVEKLKSVLDSVVSSDEKDQKIEDLRSSLNKYKKLQDIVHSNHSKKMADNSGSAHLYEDDFMSSSSISCDAKKFQRDLSNMNTPQVPMSLASTSSIPSKFDHSVHCYYSTNLIKTLPSSSTFTSPFHKSNSVENICPASSQLHAYSSKSQYGTMPRQSGSEVLQQLQVSLCENEAEANERLPMVEKSEFPANMNIMKMHNKSTKGTGGKSSGVSFGKGFFKLRSGKRSSSEPHLGDKENTDNSVLLPTQPFIIKSDKEKNKGFLKFFSKWKRSGSQNIDRIDGDFKRGGVRATAGPRLGWSRDLPNDPDIPFNRWSADMIVEWLHRLGLSMYISECKRWMCNGEMLIKATASDLEKELNMKNPLHKKKLLLAIKSSGLSNLPSAINALDYHWVVRWLDDVGLPQYKDAFTEARVDGRVLHCITVDDLMFLKVTSQLHHISIRCGIQLLREKGFDPHCLIRRSLPDESKVYTPELVALWSNHRVMEWLRTVDLSEYAPNLRGSGVHGALIVYEPKFNTNLFATLLNIPPTKTLLRRHLATHFKHIVGDDLMQVKREKETETPLSPSVKIKVMRKTQFALKKKRNKTDFENEDYVCPLDIPVATDAPKLSDGDKLVVRRNSDPSPHEQKHLDLKEETVERIGAVSKEISSLTTILQGENLNEAPTTIV